MLRRKQPPAAPAASGHAAATPGASMALTPSTTHGGHPASRGAPVPYKGSAPALNDVVAGHIPLMFCDIPPAIGMLRRTLAATER